MFGVRISVTPKIQGVCYVFRVSRSLASEDTTSGSGGSLRCYIRVLHAQSVNDKTKINKILTFFIFPIISNLGCSIGQPSHLLRKLPLFLFAIELSFRIISCLGMILIRA